MKEKFHLIAESRNCRSLRPGDVLIRDEKLWVSVNQTEKGYLLKSLPGGETYVLPGSEDIKIVTEARCELVT